MFVNSSLSFPHETSNEKSSEEPRLWAPLVQGFALLGIATAKRLVLEGS